MPDPSPLLGPPYVSLYNDIWGSRVRSNYEGATALESASSSWSSFAMLHRDNAICEILFWPLRLKLTTLTNFLNQRVIVGSLCRFFVSGARDAFGWSSLLRAHEKFTPKSGISSKSFEKVHVEFPLDAIIPRHSLVSKRTCRVAL
jgi:hypothetical protein